jgi:hypothetical protein
MRCSCPRRDRAPIFRLSAPASRSRKRGRPGRRLGADPCADDRNRQGNAQCRNICGENRNGSPPLPGARKIWPPTSAPHPTRTTRAATPTCSGWRAARPCHGRARRGRCNRHGLHRFSQHGGARDRMPCRGPRRLFRQDGHSSRSGAGHQCGLHPGARRRRARGAEFWRCLQRPDRKRACCRSMAT